MAGIVERQQADGLLTETGAAAKTEAIFDNVVTGSDLTATVAERLPSALAESVSELPGRINTAIDAAGKSILGSIPVWLRWLIGGAVVAYLFVLIRPYLPTQKPAPAKPSRKK
ncbi:hypothetical protein Ga0100231_005375 [Opitutaceae bacterium TAV4]|nr:hypothetical protein Ga0100231_005375 [Opitutaceae bacterium TAV4]RRK02594.1 hypothetical protein Ga0100230_005625 [Opitutaceae bacterium TAV3]